MPPGISKKQLRDAAEQEVAPRDGAGAVLDRLMANGGGFGGEVTVVHRAYMAVPPCCCCAGLGWVGLGWVGLGEEGGTHYSAHQPVQWGCHVATWLHPAWPSGHHSPC